MPDEPDSLLALTRQLRRLAIRLVGDDHTADDLVQDACVTAIERPPTRSPFGWLAVVVRNRARELARRDARRERREQAVARPEAAVDGTDERLAVCRRVLAAVERLGPEQRAVVVARYFEDQPPRAIAGELGISVHTVRTRLRRAIERLRAELDDSYGDRRTWVTVLTPLVQLETEAVATAAVTTGALAVHANVKLAVLAAILIGVGLVVLWPRPETIGPASASAALGPPDAVATRTRTEPSAATTTIDAAAGDSTRVAVEDHAWTIEGRARLAQTAAPAVALDLVARATAGGEVVFEQKLTTDERGAFTVAGKGPGQTAELVFESATPTHAVVSDPLYLPRGRAPEHPVGLRVLSLDVEISGVVTAPDGQPIAGAKVLGRRRTAFTDEDGRYSVRETSDYADTEIRVLAAGFAMVTRSFPVRPGAKLREDFVLAPGFRVRGIVRGPDGRPVPGVTIRTSVAYEDPATTDRDGRYEIASIGRDREQVFLFTRHPRFRNASREIAVQGDGAECDFDLVTGIRVSGRVFDPNGRPVEAARVYLAPSAINNGEPDAITRADGSFEIAGASRWWKPIAASAHGFGLTFVELEMPASGDHLDGVEIVLRGSRTIRGRVRSSSRQPVVDAAVFVSRTGVDRMVGSLGLLAHTDRRGEFTIRDLPDDPVEVTIVQDGFRRTRELLPVGIDRAELTMTLIASVAGTVVDAATGEPIERFAVRFIRPKLDDGEQAVESYWARWTAGNEFRDPDGVWSTGDEEFVPGLVLGVEIRADGYAPAILDHLVTTVDPDPAERVTRLEPGTSLAGSVLADGEPVPGALVYMFGPADRLRGRYDDHLDGSGVRNIRTGPDGRFAFDSAYRGEVRLLAKHPDYAPKVVGPIHLTDHVERTVELDRGCRVTGRLVGPDGRAPSGAVVELARDELHRSWKATTDVAGRYSFERLLPGPYRLLLAEPTRTGHRYLAQRDVDITGAETAVDLNLREGDASIRGRVAGGAEAALLRPLDAASQLTRTAWLAAGRYAFEGLAAGSYEVSVGTVGGRRTERVTLNAGQALELDFE